MRKKRHSLEEHRELGNSFSFSPRTDSGKTIDGKGIQAVEVEAGMALVVS
jgi:hypothetical protein|tara:strand:+ start:8576 stop:8725 length:150 start_codon:yes stop_codon:yes gene_type:complete